ncbi:hypothetical protein [Hyphococcus luteus]|nr:hypothetical protein [Marinicaulis flavus]
MSFQRKIFLSILAISVILLFVCGYVGLFELVPLLREKIQNNDETFLQLAGDAGVFYSFLIGVPLSVIVALAAAVIGGEITERQGDIDTLRFAEEKVEGALEVFLRILNTLHATFLTGNVVSDVIYSLVSSKIHQIEDEDGNFDLDGLIELTEEQFSKPRESLCDELEKLQAAIGQSKKDLYAPIILQQSLKRSNNDETGLTYIRKNLPQNHGVEKGLLEPDLYQIGHLLSAWASDITAIDAIEALTLMPDTYRSSDYIGMMLQRKQYVPTSGTAEKLGPDHVTDVFYNFGAAWIMQAYRALPKNDDVSSIFREILKGRSHIAMRLLDAVSPDVGRLESREWLENMEAALTERDNYIILRLEDGSTKAYVPKLHGSLASLSLSQA